MNHDIIVHIFAGIGVVLGIIYYFIFYYGKNTGLKRKYFRPFVIGSSLLFAGFSIFMAGRVGFPTPFIIVPLIGLWCIFSLRNTKFCDACGKTNISQNPFAPPEYCSKCGGKLQEAFIK